MIIACKWTHRTKWTWFLKYLCKKDTIGIWMNRNQILTAERRNTTCPKHFDSAFDFTNFTISIWHNKSLWTYCFCVLFNMLPCFYCLGHFRSSVNFNVVVLLAEYFSWQVNIYWFPRPHWVLAFLAQHLPVFTPHLAIPAQCFAGFVG